VADDGEGAPLGHGVPDLGLGGRVGHADFPFENRAATHAFKEVGIAPSSLSKFL
jgi:hypothetical protein